MELHENKTESTATLHNKTSENVSENKFKRILNLITVEPVLFLYLFSTSLATGALNNMTFEMGCRTNLQLNDTVCSDYTEGIKYVAVLIGRSVAWSHPIQTAVTAILVLSFGSFSDRSKIRKPFFILPIVGEVFSCIGLILCAVFISQWPIEMFFVMALIVPSFFGGGQTVIMAIYSYITDNSTQEERTTRIGFVEIASLILTPIGPAAGGLLFLNIGYFGIYSICLILYLLAIFYALIFIKEKKGPKRDKNLCVDVFNIKTVVIDMFKIVIRKRSGYKRLLLILSYVCYILIKGPITAESVYIRNYVTETFKWHVDYYGYFQAFDIIVHVLGMLLAVTIFTKKLKLHDCIIAVIACVFKIIVGIWYAFGKNAYMFCIGPLISVFSGLFVIALRSLVTKLISASEIALAQAFFAVCEALCPIIFSAGYAKFYASTHDVQHGAFFLLSSALVAVPAAILLGMYVLHKKQGVEVEPEEEKKDSGENIEIERL